MNRLDIQYGTSFFYPISSVGAHVSACPNHQTGRSVPLSTRADVALAGSFGYELDLRLLSDEEKAQVKEQIKEFHDYYDLTHEEIITVLQSVIIQALQHGNLSQRIKNAHL